MKTWKRISSGQFASVSFNIFHFILWILNLKLGRYIIKRYVLTMYQFQPFFHQLFMNDILSDHNQYHYQRIGNLRYSREFFIWSFLIIRKQNNNSKIRQAYSMPNYQCNHKNSSYYPMGKTSLFLCRQANRIS